MTVQNLFLGFGGTGAHILTYVKELAVQKHGTRPEHLEFMEFDTIADWKPGDTIHIAGDAGAEEKIAKGEEISLDPATEYFQLKDAAVSFASLCAGPLADEETRLRDYPHFNEWLHSDWLRQHLPRAALNLTRGAARERQIGRFGMFANARAIINELMIRLQRLQQRADGDSVNVWIAGSAAGGTGAGCLIDAAYLTRIAGVNLGREPIITAVVVLPSVYMDVFAEESQKRASLARAYSFFRELERVQSPLGAGENYKVDNATVLSEVKYSANGSSHARVASKLFDYRVYLSAECTGESDRTRFFSSVANCLDAFVDKNVSSKLLQDQNNATGAPAGFGASRLVLPKNTFAERFAWRQVDRYIKAITAPDIDSIGGSTDRFFCGAENDRRAAADSVVRGFLPLFSEILDRSSLRAEERENYARRNLSPREIVEQWFQIAAVNPAQFSLSDAELRELPVLLYCNPFISSEEGADESMPPEQVLLKTYSENQKAKGLKEDQKSSAARFADELIRIRDRYLSPQAGNGSFEKGLRFVGEVNERRMRQAVDEWILSVLKPPQNVGLDVIRPGEGTVLTRLYREICWLTTQGALKKVADVIAEFIASVRKQMQEDRLQQNANDAVDQLRQAKKSGFLDLSAWVETPQRSARDDMMAYLHGVQKQRLLDEMLRLTQIVNERLIAWREQIRANVLETLVLGQPDHPAALTLVAKRINQLTNRLERMKNNGSLVLSVGDPTDVSMDGFEAEMEKTATVREDGRSLCDHLLERTHWRVETNRAGEPQISLQVEGLPPDDSYGQRALHERLYQSFRRDIDARLAEIDVFDYLLHAQRRRGIEPAKVISRLRERLQVLLTVDGVQTLPSIKLIYRGASSAHADKANLAGRLQAELASQKESMTVEDAISNHTDKDSITLFGSVSPDGIESHIHDIRVCAARYLDSYVEFSGNEALRSLTHHVFRAEQEAWFIERTHIVETHHKLSSPLDLMPPQVTRLLEQPGMMQMFVHCLATGAIRMADDDTEEWIYERKPGEIVRLTTKKQDLLRAAVVFVLQQRAKANDLRSFTPAEALAAAQEAVKSLPLTSGQPRITYPGVLKAALQSKKLDELVDKYFLAQHLRPGGGKEVDKKNGEVERTARALKQVFAFYLPYGRGVSLSERAL